MRILHTSDLHGQYKRLLGVSAPFDVWVDTGDFFPNQGRTSKTGYHIDASMEIRHQKLWVSYRTLGARIQAWLGGRPVISVGGNHDFLSFADLFDGRSVDLHQITPDGADVLGLRWSGFRHIPPMDGDWPGETDDFADLIARVAASTPDVLVTHAPDAAFARPGYGVPGLHASLGPQTRLHLHGHDHTRSGQVDNVGSIRAYNGATQLNMIDF